MSLLSSLSERNLILTGHIGPGQPLLGRRIAERLRMPFVNIETEVTDRAGMTMDEIRTYFGETRLQSIESEIMGETILRRGTVIRISGRTLLHAENLPRLQSTGAVLCLYVELGAMLQRLHVSMGARYHDPKERAFVLGELQREWAVRGRKDVYEVNTTDMDDETIIDHIISFWQEFAMRRA